MKNLLIFLCLCLPFAACKDDEQICQFEDGDYLIFGTFYGECAGNCTVLYKIENDLLFEDDHDIGIPEEIPFQSTPLSNEKFLIAEELRTTFPSDLLDSDKETYGCPDCHDQGGVYLELYKGDVKRKWNIDADDDEQSTQIIDYKRRLYMIMDSLQ